MSETHQIFILKKDEKIFTSISTMPTKDVYAMLYGAIRHVAKHTRQTVKDTLAVLDDLDNFAEASGRKEDP